MAEKRLIANMNPSLIYCFIADLNQVNLSPRFSYCAHYSPCGLDRAVFYVPANTVQVIRQTVFTGQKTQPTVSKY